MTTRDPMPRQLILSLVEKATATIYRYNGRRYLTKRGAYMAKARAILGEHHVRVDEEDMARGLFCDCLLCNDAMNGYVTTRAMAKQLAADDARTQP